MYLMRLYYHTVIRLWECEWSVRVFSHHLQRCLATPLSSWHGAPNKKSAKEALIKSYFVIRGQSRRAIFLDYWAICKREDHGLLIQYFLLHSYPARESLPHERSECFGHGTTHVIFEPLDFLARLAALVPKPRGTFLSLPVRIRKQKITSFGETRWRYAVGQADHKAGLYGI